MPSLPDFRLETYLARWEFAARFHMTASDAESMCRQASFGQKLTPLPQDRFRIGYGRSYVPAGLEAMRDWLAKRL